MMRARGLYLKLQCKKYGKMLPVVLAQSFLLALIIVLIGTVAVKVMGQGSSFAQIKVAVVSEEEKSLTGLLINFVEGMDSFEGNCSFVQMDEEEAYRGLEAGEIYAAVFLPQGLLDSILSGSNIPAEVVLSRACSRLETAVFEEVASAGGKMLSVAQAGIYAADALCIETGNSDKIAETEGYLNEAYLDYALNRTSIFELEEITAIGKVEPVSYYGISLLLFFLSFAAVVMGRYAKVKPDAHATVLAALGMRPIWQYFCDAIAFAAVVVLLGGIIGCPILCICAVREGVRSAMSGLCITYVFVLLSVALFVRLLLQICGNDNGGIGSVFTFLFAVMFACGFLIPTAFLPIYIEKVGKIFPYKYWMEMLLGALQGKGRVEQILVMLFADGIVLLIGMSLFWLRCRRNGRKERQS